MLKILNRRKKSVKYRLIMDFGAILVGVCVFYYVLVLCIYTNMIDTKEQDKSEIITNASINHVRLLVSSIETTLGNIARIDNISNDKLGLEERVDLIRRYNTYFQDMMLLDVNGQGRSINGLTFQWDPNEELIETLEGKLELVNYKDEEYMIFGKSIRDELDQVQAIIVGIYKIRDVFEDIKNLSDGKIYFLANEDGQVFYSVVEEMQIKESGGIENDSDVDVLFGENLQFGEEYCLEIENPYTHVLSDLHYGLVSENGWILGVVSHKGQKELDLINFKRDILIGIILAIVIGILLIYIIATSVAKRMLHIAHYLEDSIENEFQDSVPHELLEGEDEISIIAKEIKHLEEQMLDTLTDVKESMNYLNEKINVLNEVKDKKE
ncbi:MAG: hypothetical protein E7231_01790 [Cellulosilyticum sp.]|nr:hypothetical protein [Cellulosilyticum sp.]